jgi:hypothetical protein
MSSRRELAASLAPSDSVSVPTPPAAAAAADAATARPPSRRPTLAPPPRATSAPDTTTRRRRALAELERRIAALEVQGRDLEQRNEQLRRQVACRTTAAEARVMVACVIGVDGGGKVEGGGAASLEIHAPGTSAACPDSAAAAAAALAEAAAAAAADRGAPQGALRRSFRRTRSGVGGGGGGGGKGGPVPGFSTAAATAQAMAAAVAAADDDHAVRVALAAADKERMLRASVMGMMARQQPQQQQTPSAGSGSVAAGHEGNQDHHHHHHNPIASSGTSAGILAAAAATFNCLVEQMRDEALVMSPEEYARNLGALNARLGLAIWRHGGKAGAAPADEAALRAIEADIEPSLVRALGRVAALARFRPDTTRLVLGLDLDTLRPLPLQSQAEDDALMVRATRAAGFSDAQLSMLAAVYEDHLPITWRVDERMRAAAAAAAAASAGVGILEEALAEVRGALADGASAGNAAAASFSQVVTPVQLAVICASLHPRAFYMTHGLRACYLVWREQQQDGHKEEGGGGAGAGAGAGGSGGMAHAAEPLQAKEEEIKEEQEEQEEQEQGPYARRGAPISLA